MKSDAVGVRPDAVLEHINTPSSGGVLAPHDHLVRNAASSAVHLLELVRRTRPHVPKGEPFVYVEFKLDVPSAHEIAFRTSS